MFVSLESSYREVDVDDVVKEALALSVTMLKLLGQCPTKIQNSLEFSIGRWFEAYSLYHRISRPVDLVQTWVKVLIRQCLLILIDVANWGGSGRGGFTNEPKHFCAKRCIIVNN